MDAIAFALEGDPSEYDSDTQEIALEVSVASATRGPAILILWFAANGLVHHNVEIVSYDDGCAGRTNQ